MTHVSNVQSFEKLLGICTGFGGSYNPGQQNLRIENLTAMLKQAQDKLLQVSIAKSHHEEAQNNREVAFAAMRTLTPRILAELKASRPMRQTIADAMVMARKIRGDKAEKPVTAESKEGMAASVAVTRKRNSADFGNSMAYFEKLLQTLGNEPMYQPANPEMQMVNLQAVLDNLRNLNAAVTSAYAAWSVARRERDNFLYVGPECLHSTAMAVKQQVKATFGYRDEVTALVRKIRFTKLN